MSTATSLRSCQIVRMFSSPSPFHDRRILYRQCNNPRRVRYLCDDCSHAQQAAETRAHSSGSQASPSENPSPPCNMEYPQPPLRSKDGSQVSCRPASRMPQDSLHESAGYSSSHSAKSQKDYRRDSRCSPHSLRGTPDRVYHPCTRVQADREAHRPLGNPETSCRPMLFFP